MIRRRLLSLSLLSVSLLLPVFFSEPLHAQTTTLPACFIGLEDGTVGVPYYCDFGTALNQFYAPYLSQDTGVSLTFTFGVTAGSILPPGLTITQSGVFSGTPTTPGPFNFSIDITFNISVSGQTFSETIPFPATLQIDGVATGSTMVNPAGLVFSLNQSTTTSSQSISLSSRRSQAITYTAAASTISGGSWLSVTGSGTINPFQSTSAVVSVNASGLSAGVYGGAIQLTLSSEENFSLPVLLTITGGQQSLVISQSGVYFQAVQGGTSPPAQTIAVLNGGSGSLNYSASAATLSGGNWLSVSPAGGTTTSSAAPVAINVNSAGLAPSTYYGKVQISATGLANSPQTVSVVLTVSSPAQSPGPSLSATGLIFVAHAGGTAAIGRGITVTNPSPNPLNFSSTAFSDTSTNFYTVSPASGTLTSGQPVTINVQPAAGLTAGVYTGSVTLVFADSVTQATYQHRLAVVLIVVPGAGTGTQARAPQPQLTTACASSKLILVFTQLGDAFQIPVAWPSPLEVTVVDDCGNFMTQGSVINTFSTGDPPLALASLKDGRWSGTWVPRNSSAQVTIVAQGQEPVPALTGSAQIGGGLQANPAVPVIDAGGVVSAASNAPRQPLAPGSYISVYGNNLSLSSNSASTLPLQTQLGGTQVILAGEPLPLTYAGNGQINAIVPFDTPVNTQQQLIVQDAATLSVPEPVVLSTAQPAIFTQDDSGTGLGVIVGFKADHSASFVIDNTHPVSAGDYLVIYCTGLGPVDQQVAAGSAGPSSPLANTINPVTATIGGQNATVVFAGLAPGLTVYQVNVIVPAGVTSGTGIPVVLFQAGQQSLPVTIAVQ